MSETFGERAGKLAAAAMALNSAGGVKTPFALAFLTDPRGPGPISVAEALPEGAAILLRHYDDPAREALARRLAAVAARRGLVLMIGAEAGLARKVGAAGVHLRAGQLSAPPALEGLLVTAACHSAGELARAAAIGASLALLSPAFPTRSHPGAAALGPERFRALAETSPIPVIALGGVDETNAAALAGKNVAGLAAISAFAPKA
ncbi:MAG: thiamine phosphate synthase [Parvularculaceae bacterium]